MASASTSDHHPMPMQATRSGPAFTTSPSPGHLPTISSSRRSTRRPPWRCANRSAQSPPLTPTPPMHWPSTRIGTPPSIAVQRSGPAASARPSAWSRRGPGRPRPWPWSARRLEAAHTALVVQECSVWKRPPSMRSSNDHVPAGIDDAAGDRDLGLAGLVEAVVMIFLAP